MYHSKHKCGNTLAVVFLLIASLGFRFVFSATHIAFGQDIARDNWLIQQRIENQTLIVDYGPKASVGNFYLPPLYYQIHVVFSLISHNDPLTMKWVITFIEALSPVILFLVLKELFNTRLAVLSSLVYIVAPIPLQYGTTAWNPNMIPFLSLLILYSSIQVIKHKRFWYIPVACVTFITAFQFHYQAMVLFPFLVIIFIYTTRVLDVKNLCKYWLFGVLLMFVTLLPYFAAELQNNFQNTSAIITYFSQEHAQYYERISKPTYIATFFPQFFDRVLFGKETYHSIIGLCIYFGGIFTLLHSYHRSKRFETILILMYFLSIMLMLRVFKGDKLDYYLSTLYFMPFILLTSLFEAIKSKFVIGSFFGLLVFSLGIHLSQWRSYDDFTGLRQTMEYIQQNTPDKSVRLLFHDDDFVNTVFYGINIFTSLKIDSNSTTTIDICNNKDVCAWDSRPDSKHSLAYSQIAQFKADAQFTQLSHRFGNVPFQVIIGRIANPATILNTTGFMYQGEQGSDFLMSY